MLADLSRDQKLSTENVSTMTATVNPEDDMVDIVGTVEEPDLPLILSPTHEEEEVVPKPQAPPPARPTPGFVFDFRQKVFKVPPVFLSHRFSPFLLAQVEILVEKVFLFPCWEVK